MKKDSNEYGYPRLPGMYEDKRKEYGYSRLPGMYEQIDSKVTNSSKIKKKKK